MFSGVFYEGKSPNFLDPCVSLSKALLNLFFGGGGGTLGGVG